MSDVKLLCKSSTSGSLIPIALSGSEDKAKDLADDGDFYIIPIQVDRIYNTLLDINIVGSVGFNNTSQKTLIQQVKTAIQNIHNRLDGHDTQLANIVSQGQTLNQLVQDIDARVTALEGST